MMTRLGLRSVEDLFRDIPQGLRTDGLDLPEGVDEMELRRRLESVLSSNEPASRWLSFLGGGVYYHHIPAVVRAVAFRSEFATSYTPYQSEVSQGMLQALFEYQSIMAELTAMDYVNCSVYDYSTALGEAVLMSHRLRGGDRFLVSRATSPERTDVARVYARGADIDIDEVGYDPESGAVDAEDLESKMSDDVCGFYFETPNVFGALEEGWKRIRDIVGDRVLAIGSNPLALALIRPPGEMGADIVIGDAQPLGVPMSFGGPSIGVFGCREEHVRKMPGRIIGMTEDEDGRRSFCMTLQTREQHIRRSKATSNICTNEALLAVAVAAHVATLGRSGLRRMALRNIQNMKALSEGIDALEGFEAPAFQAHHFNEFVVRSSVAPEDVNRALRDASIHGGFPLGRWFPDLKDCSLVATTEMHSPSDISRLTEALEGIR
ncbi:MAG: aminomethyl-transferring glycine dehydrogenase subunit GcvPA [Methanobacteriota archaeon]|nr:MAG: aminomethyl-transferring glycine dehydrogenase subunit GcvPA [Euryarchaeota archaeon]